MSLEEDPTRKNLENSLKGRGTTDQVTDTIELWYKSKNGANSFDNAKSDYLKTSTLGKHINFYGIEKMLNDDYYGKNKSDAYQSIPTSRPTSVDNNSTIPNKKNGPEIYDPDLSHEELEIGQPYPHGGKRNTRRKTGKKTQKKSKKGKKTRKCRSRKVGRRLLY